MERGLGHETAWKSMLRARYLGIPIHPVVGL